MSRQSYLILLRTETADAARAAAESLTQAGIQVIARFNDVAIEAEATAEQLSVARRDRNLLAVVKGPVKKDHLEKLSEKQRAIAAIWNSRFTASYRKSRDRPEHLGKSWSAEGYDAPMGSSKIDARDFFQFVDNWYREHDRKRSEIKASEKAKDEPQRLSGKDFVKFERDLAKHFGDETIAYHIARIGAHLDRDRRRLLFDLPIELIRDFFDHWFGEAACWEMHSEIAIGIVFVESSRRGGPKFTTTERNQICQEIFDGHRFLTSQHPGGNLRWVYDTQFISIDVANGSGSPAEDYWRDPAMGLVNYNGTTYAATWAGVGDYREDMRIVNRSAHAIAIFVTPYANSWHAYAGGGRITLANRNNWGGWGQGTIDIITAHETCHLFGAADEYTGSGTPCSSCSTTHGCDNIVNGNCGACANPRQDCLMDANARRICAYTKGQIGWSTLFLETKTGDVAWAGTDDDVWLDIGDHVFVIDTPDRDDRERNYREGYAIWAPWVRRSDIKRVMIRKSSDGFAGGWRLEGMRLWHNGTLICDQPRINRWLEDQNLTWVGCVADRDIVNTLRVKVSTADVTWAGTDDDVRVTLQGRSWNLDNDNHDDFERGHADTFDLDPGTSFYASAIHSIEIHKSPDGIAGGWKLKGVEVIVNGNTIYNNQGINRWLEDNHRTWSGTF